MSKTHQMSAREVALGQTPAAATMTRSGWTGAGLL